MKKTGCILFALLFLVQGVQAGVFDSKNILIRPDYLAQLEIKLKEFTQEKKCHGIQIFYVSRLHVYKEDDGQIMREVDIYWINGDMLYYYFGEDEMLFAKSNNLRKDVYKTRKEIEGSTFLMTEHETKEFIQRCKKGNKVIIKMPLKKE